MCRHKQKWFVWTFASFQTIQKCILEMRRARRSSGKEIQEVEAVPLEHVLAVHSLRLGSTGNAHAGSPAYANYSVQETERHDDRIDLFIRHFDLSVLTLPQWVHILELPRHALRITSQPLVTADFLQCDAFSRVFGKQPL